MEPDSFVIVGCPSDIFEECRAFLLNEGCTLEVIRRANLKSVQNDIGQGIYQPAIGILVTDKQNVQDREYFMNNQMFVELSQRMAIFVTGSPDNIMNLLQKIVSLPSIREMFFSTEEQLISPPTLEPAAFKQERTDQGQWQLLYKRGLEQDGGKSQQR